MDYFTYIMNQKNLVYRKLSDELPKIDAFPQDPIAAGWAPMD